MIRVVAIDLGASSGRVMVCEYDTSLRPTEVHRFPNGPHDFEGCLVWDFDSLMENIICGIKKAAEGGPIDSIGIDTWGVDFGMLDCDGKLIMPPVNYRDARTERMPDEVFQKIDRHELYSRTGIQFMNFNTIYQLWYVKEHTPEIFSRVKKILLMPDLIAYMLTGCARTELTNASTTNLLNAKTQLPDSEILSKLGISSDIFAPMIRPGEVYGNLTEEMADACLCGRVPVVAVCTHDTASAVASVPAPDGDAAYISSGTWSLMGIELPAPLCTKDAEACNFTNEIGYGGNVRFLKNIMGLWILQELRKSLCSGGKNVSFAQMEALARAAKCVSVIDVDDPRFLRPGDMAGRVRECCAESGQEIPVGDGEVIRCIYESLAAKYKYVFEHMEKLTGTRHACLNIVGGGSRDSFLCELTSEALNLPVTAGPIEATATGNAAVQLMRAGVFGSLKEARHEILRGGEIRTYRPSGKQDMNEKYKRLLSLISEEKI